MAIQSSINSLLSQAQRLATFYTGFDKAGQIIKDTTATKGEAQIQTEIAAGNAPMKDGKVDPEWLKSRRDDIYKTWFYPNGELAPWGEGRARFLYNKVERGIELHPVEKEFYNNKSVQAYLNSFNEKNARFESALDRLKSSINPELKNKIARNSARASVEARTDNLNQSKSDFDAHTASLIKEYGKGSERH